MVKLTDAELGMYFTNCSKCGERYWAEDGHVCLPSTDEPKLIKTIFEVGDRVNLINSSSSFKVDYSGGILLPSWVRHFSGALRLKSLTILIVDLKVPVMWNDHNQQRDDEGNFVYLDTMVQEEKSGQIWLTQKKFLQHID